VLHRTVTGQSIDAGNVALVSPCDVIELSGEDHLPWAGTRTVCWTRVGVPHRCPPRRIPIVWPPCFTDISDPPSRQSDSAMPDGNCAKTTSVCKG
jgi:hypothetical protein